MNRRLGQAALVVGLVAATWAISAAEITTAQLQAPFAVEGGPGERLTGRNISAVVVPDGTAPVTADVLEIDGIDRTELDSSGVFLLVPVAASTVVEPGRLAFARIELDGAHYSALSNRLDYDDPWMDPLAVGIDRHADIVFEVPPRKLDQVDTLIVDLALSADPTLDSVIRVVVPTAQIGHEERTARADVVEVVP